MKLDATLFERVQESARAASSQLDVDGADVAVVLGSGLGGVADRLTRARTVPYASLPGFPETTVAGHPGRLVAGAIGDRTALLLCGPQKASYTVVNGRVIVRDGQNVGEGWHERYGSAHAEVNAFQAAGAFLRPRARGGR